MSLWKSMFDPSARQGILARLQALRPDTPPRWGRMNARQMICHLSDQMRHSMELSPVEPRLGLLRRAWVRWIVIYVIPWPKGRVKGPPEAFLSQPLGWKADLEELVSLVDRFVTRGPAADWPEHAMFGKMTGADWGFFVHKHFDHHLRQFGV